jgi:hypothetical protein
MLQDKKLSSFKKYNPKYYKDTPIHLKKIAGSLKNKTPTIKVPAAPIPVHTAYAVLIDIPLRESHN